MYWANDIAKKLYNHIITKLREYKMNTTIINSENSETLDLQRLILNRTDKTNLKMSNKHVALSNISITIHWKTLKKSNKNNTLKMPAPKWNGKF